MDLASTWCSWRYYVMKYFDLFIGTTNVILIWSTCNEVPISFITSSWMRARDQKHCQYYNSLLPLRGELLPVSFFLQITPVDDIVVLKSLCGTCTIAYLPAPVGWGSLWVALGLGFLYPSRASRPTYLVEFGQYVVPDGAGTPAWLRLPQNETSYASIEDVAKPSSAPSTSSGTSSIVRSKHGGSMRSRT